MIPKKRIGRYEFRVTDVLAVEQRRYWWASIVRLFWPNYEPGYDVALSGGLAIYLTAKEKAELDKAIETHNEVIGMFGFMKTLGFRG